MSTHTYAILRISPAAFTEIKDRLGAAGYSHAFNEQDGELVIDMHGIALAKEQTVNANGRKRKAKAS